MAKKAQGLDVAMFPTEGDGWLARLGQILQQGDVGFALTMSGVGADATVDGKLLWDVHKVPLFNWCCDHPCYFPIRQVLRSPYLLHGYVFPDHARYNFRHFRSNGVAYAVHLGIPPRSIFPRAPLQVHDRNGRIMFTKSGRDTNEMEARWRNYGSEISHILFAAAEELLHRPTGDFIPVLQRIAEPRGLFIDGNSSMAMALIGELDPYIRFRRANLVMQSVLQYPVDVYGTGWDHIAWDGARARYYGAMPWKSMVEQLPGYSGCLSTNPLIDESVHDRVFFALAAGVPPISDSNAFSRTNMPGLERYAFAFTPEQIGQAVNTVLAEPAAAIQRTEDAWQALSGPFGLRRSVSQIAQFALLHRVNAQVTLR